MGTISDALKYWQSVDVVLMAAQAVEDHPNVISDKIRQQLLQGIKGTGEKLKPYHSKAYAAKKHEKNPRPGLGTPDFYLTGETHKSIFTIPDENKNSLLTGSNADTAKVLFLQGRDGNSIFQPTEQSTKEAGDAIHAIVISRLSNESGCPIG